MLVEGGKKGSLPNITFVIDIRKKFHDVPWHKLQVYIKTFHTLSGKLTGFDERCFAGFADCRFSSSLPFAFASFSPAFVGRRVERGGEGKNVLKRL